MDGGGAALRCVEGECRENGQIGVPLTAPVQVFKDATLFFSRSTPNLTMVIPAMDHIDERLTNDSLNQDLEPSIRAAIALAKKTLNRYYSKTDQSELYRVTMSACFHSSHRFT